MTTCKNCNTEIKLNFCANCGHPKDLKRIDNKYIISEIGSIVYFHRGLFYTIKELFLRPGKAVKEFILTDRKRLVKPIFFLIICSVIYTVAQEVFSFKDGYINMSFEDWHGRPIGKMYNWISQNYGYANVMIAIFMALWLKLLFRKSNYNIYEIFILLCFIMGSSMLIFTFFGIFEGLSQYSVLQYGVNLSIIYCAWAIGSFFDGNKVLKYIKALVSYFLGMVSFIFVIVIIGILAEKVV